VPSRSFRDLEDRERPPHRDPLLWATGLVVLLLVASAAVVLWIALSR